MQPCIAALMVNKVHGVHHKVHLGHERLFWEIAHLQRYSRINLVVSVLPAPDSPEKVGLHFKWIAASLRGGRGRVVPDKKRIQWDQF